ncbi:MAG: hypothetical protein ABJ327_03770 [Litoreibacter sp.]
MGTELTRLDSAGAVPPSKIPALKNVISYFKGRRIERRMSAALSPLGENISKPGISSLRTSVTSVFRFLISSKVRHDYFLARREKIIRNEIIKFEANFPKTIRAGVVVGWKPAAGQDIDPNTMELINRPGFDPDFFFVEAKDRDGEGFEVKFEPEIVIIKTRTIDDCGWYSSAKNACLAQISEALSAGDSAENEALGPDGKKVESFLEGSLRSYFEAKRAPKSAEYIRELANRLTKQKHTDISSVGSASTRSQQLVDSRFDPMEVGEGNAPKLTVLRGSTT